MGSETVADGTRPGNGDPLLANGVPVNVLSRWLGHRWLETTLVYLELLPDPTGSVEAIP